MRSLSSHLLPLLLYLSLVSISWAFEPPRPMGVIDKTHTQGQPFGDKRYDARRQAFAGSAREPRLSAERWRWAPAPCACKHTEGGVVDEMGYPTLDAVPRGVELVAIPRPLSSSRLVSLVVDGEDIAGPLCSRVMGNCEIRATFARILPDALPVSLGEEFAAVLDGEMRPLRAAPNPANEGFYVHGLEEDTEASLYCLRGTRVRRLRVEPHERASLQGLPSGGNVLRLPRCMVRFVKR